MSLFAVANLYKETNLQPYCTYGLRVVLEKCFESLSIPGKLPNVPENCSYFVKTNYIWPVQKPISLQGITELNTSITLDMYSARYEDIIKYGIDKMKVELRFKEEHILYSNKLFVSLKTKFNLENEDVTFVGMHYRGTDYIHHLKLIYKKYKPPPNYKYYKEAMTYFEKNYKNIIFILITIDDEWLNENLPNIRNNANLIVNPNDGDPVRDLVILSHCNHSIINYGTFGTAAALLNKGTTFVYDLNMPLDYRGTTIAMGIAQLLPNWHVL
ncbi:hypothetical protein FQR65_LT05616 [Abscondita terminalis]|nr:hypothetical protein FQR65_LT05616 [Abscondita terminalis]